jgi:translation initiation factor IF-3
MQVGPITVIVKRVEHTEAVGNNGFEKREIVVTTEEQHTQTLSIQFTQGKCPELDNYKTGDEVKIWLDLRGREYTKDQKTTVFNTIQGWKIEKVS